MFQYVSIQSTPCFWACSGTASALNNIRSCALNSSSNLEKNVIPESDTTHLPASFDGNIELIKDLVVQISTASKIHDQPTPVLLLPRTGSSSRFCCRKMHQINVSIEDGVVRLDWILASTLISMLRKLMWKIHGNVASLIQVCQQVHDSRMKELLATAASNHRHPASMYSTMVNLHVANLPSKVLLTIVLLKVQGFHLNDFNLKICQKCVFCIFCWLLRQCQNTIFRNLQIFGWIWVFHSNSLPNPQMTRHSIFLLCLYSSAFVDCCLT